MSGQESQSKYGSGERPQAYTTIDGNQTKQQLHDHQSEGPHTTTHQLPTRVRLPPLSDIVQTAPTSGRSAMHTNPEYYTGSQTQLVQGSGPQVPTLEVTDPGSVYQNQIRHPTQGHQSGHPYTNQTLERLPPLPSFGHTPPQPASDPGLINAYASPEGYMLQDRQNHDPQYVQQPQYLPSISQPAYQAFSQQPRQYPGPHLEYGAGYSVPNHAESLWIPVPLGIRPQQLPGVSTFPQPLLSHLAPPDRLRNFTTWEDARSYLGPLRQDAILSPTDVELEDFMYRLRARFGRRTGPVTREDTITLAQSMLRNDFLDRLEQRTDVRLHPFLNWYSTEACPIDSTDISSTIGNHDGVWRCCTTKCFGCSSAYGMPRLEKARSRVRT